MSDPDLYPAPHILVGQDGAVNISEDFARYIIYQVTMMCDYHGADGPTVAPMVLAICAGFSVGAYAPGRDMIPAMDPVLKSSVDAGLKSGMTINPNFPRLNG